jgi:hypothetical protein
VPNGRRASARAAGRKVRIRANRGHNGHDQHAKKDECLLRLRSSN